MGFALGSGQPGWPAYFVPVTWKVGISIPKACRELPTGGMEEGKRGWELTEVRKARAHWAPGLWFGCDLGLWKEHHIEFTGPDLACPCPPCPSCWVSPGRGAPALGSGCVG